jgi:hypothetical protein
VQATAPAAGASAIVATTATISVTFSEPVDPSTLTATSFSVTAGGSTVAGGVAASGATATFTPAAPLAAGASYSVVVSTAVKDMAGNPLAAAHAWSFATAAAARSWDAPVLLEQVARALFLAGLVHEQQDRTGEALARYLQVREHYGQFGAPVLRSTVAMALLRACSIHEQQGRPPEAWALALQIEELYGTDSTTGAREAVALARTLISRVKTSS